MPKSKLHNMNSFQGYDPAVKDTYYLDLAIPAVREMVKQALPAVYVPDLCMHSVTASLQSLWTIQDACGDNTGYTFSIYHA